MSITNVLVHLFPARVVTPDGRVHDPSKVLISYDRAWVYTPSGTGGGTLIGEWLLDDLWGEAARGYTMVVDGLDIKASRSHGCGCGLGAFRAWQPFPFKLVMAPIPRLAPAERR